MIKMRRHVLIYPHVWLFLISIIFLIASPSQVICSDSKEGEILVNKLWSGLKERKMEEIYRMIAPGFEAVSKKGLRDRGQEIKFLGGLYINKYSLNDLTVTRNGPVTLISYRISAEGTLQGKPVSIKSGNRLSVFLKTDTGWLWIAHANFGSQD